MSCGSGPEPRSFLLAVLRSRVPWPAQARAALLNPSWAELRRLAVETQGIVPHGALRIRLAYRLFSLSFEEGATFLALAAQAGGELLAADFKPAERNLELPAALLVRCLPQLWPCFSTGPIFADFLARGGLEGLAQEAGLRVLARRPLLGGAAVLLRLSPVARNSR